MKFSLHNKPWALLLIVLAISMAFASIRFVAFLVTPPGSGSNVQVVTVGQGADLRTTARMLEKLHLVSSARLFVLNARLRGAASRLKAGPYQISDGMTPSEILEKLVSGDVYVQRFAVPEGYSIFQVAELLQQRKIFRKDRFLAVCRDRKLLKELGVPGKSVEGFLYPSTYDIPPGAAEADIIREMVHQFDKVYDARFDDLARKEGLTRVQVVTLASMIEKEAVSPTERPLIASVFMNRLKRGMRLQSDPTAVYGVRAFGGKVSKADIERVTPYNTYLIPGLPPGPIGNPGSAAIDAVLHPAQTEYLYFVARQDGSHQFSDTLDEHNRAVRQYLR